MSLQSRILEALSTKAVKPSALRAALPDVSAEALDAAMLALRRSRQVVVRMGHYERVQEAAMVRDEPAVRPASPRAAARRAQFGRALTLREEEIRELAAEGLTAPAIAARLFIAEKSVHRHLTSVYRKLGVAGKGELAKGLAIGFSAIPAAHERQE